MLKLIRILAVPTALMGCLIFYDIFFAHTEEDIARITDKHVSHGRGGGYYLRASGRFSYNKSVPAGFWDQCTPGDEIKLSVTPVFKEWRHMALMQNGQAVTESMGKDIWWMGVAGFGFLVPCIYFLPSIGETMAKNSFLETRNLQGAGSYKLRNVWKYAIAAFVFEMVAVLLWVKVVCVLAGISPKM